MWRGLIPKCGCLVQRHVLSQQAVQNLKSRLFFCRQSHILHRGNVTLYLWACNDIRLTEPFRVRQIGCDIGLGRPSKSKGRRTLSQYYGEDPCWAAVLSLLVDNAQVDAVLANALSIPRPEGRDISRPSGSIVAKGLSDDELRCAPLSFAQNWSAQVSLGVGGPTFYRLPWVIGIRNTNSRLEME